MYKLGIIGSRLLDDIDFNSPYRSALQKNILTIINAISGKQEVVGLTGLNLGAEQDFGIVCQKHNLNYIVVIPFPNIEKGWKNLDDTQNMYKSLENKSFETITLSDFPNYSPKKQIKRNKHIVDNSDGIIFAVNHINQMKEIISYASGQAKDIFVIHVL